MPSTHFEDVHLVVHTRHGNFVIDLALLAVRAAFVTLIGALLYSVLVTKANAAEVPTGRFQSLQSIRKIAENHVRENAPLASGKEKESLIVVAGELDARLQMTECTDQPIAFTLNAALLTARNVIGVRCSSNASWTVYVPVTVESEVNVFVLRHSLPRDAHVSGTDLDSQRRRVPGFGNTYISDVATLPDQHLKRPIATGTVLTIDYLARDLLVKRGQQVILVAATNGIAIQAPGLALTDGSISDRIRVQNQTSLKVVEGIVENRNVVRVGL